MSLVNKSVIVSGGSRGIGRAIVLSLAEQGANVAFTYHKNAKAAAEVMAESLKQNRRQSGSVKSYKVDIREQCQVMEMLSDVTAKQGGIDILVNNAGIRQDKTLAFMSAESWKDVVDTNLTGAFYLTQAAIFHMLKKKFGRVIFISSVSGISGIAGQVNYSSSKAALLGFTRSLAKETARYGISVNAVAPGGVDTDMVSTLSEPERKRLLQGVPIGRLCRADEVAKVVRFLADTDAAPDYLTGSVIPLDGGFGL